MFMTHDHLLCIANVHETSLTVYMCLNVYMWLNVYVCLNVREPWQFVVYRRCAWHLISCTHDSMYMSRDQTVTICRASQMCMGRDSMYTYDSIYRYSAQIKSTLYLFVWLYMYIYIYIYIWHMCLRRDSMYTWLDAWDEIEWMYTCLKARGTWLNVYMSQRTWDVTQCIHVSTYVRRDSMYTCLNVRGTWLFAVHGRCTCDVTQCTCDLDYVLRMASAHVPWLFVVCRKCTWAVT